jgi:hypothetical protein
VVRIQIEEMSGKEDLGKDRLKDAVLKALENKTQFPIVLEQTS